MVVPKVKNETPPSTTWSTLINKRYRVIKELGTGGMGVGYLVEDNLRDREQLVLKTLNPSYTDVEVKNSLRREFEILASLQHTGLVKVYDFGHISGQNDFFFTMEYVKGKEFLSRANAIGFSELKSLIVQILQALGYIHSFGICHGDLKSANVLISSNGKYKNKVKVLDFGLAQTFSTELNQKVCGTLEYMAPEIFRGSPLSVKTDLYALGILMYWAIAGSPPFTGSADEIKNGHLNQPPPSLIKCNQEIGPDFDKIIMRCLAKRPDERYACSEDVLRALCQNSRVRIWDAEEITSRLVRAFGQLRANKIKKMIEQMNASENVAANPARSQPNLFIISGNEGCGHNHLLNIFKHHLQLENFKVYETRCKSGLKSPFQLFVDVFKNDAIVSSNNFDGFGLTTTNETPAISEEVFADRMDKGLNSSVWRYRFMDRFASEIKMACRKEPIALVVNDIELADEYSLDLLFYLCRALDKQNFVACVSFTTDSMSDIMLRNFQQHTTSIQSYFELKAQPLTVNEVKSLVRTAFGSITIPVLFFQRLIEASGGILTIIIDIFTELYDRGYLKKADGQWIVLDGYNLEKLAPRNIKEHYHRIVASLSDEQKRILQYVAAFNSAIDIDLFGKIMAKPSGAVQDDIDQLINKKILLISVSEQGYRTLNFASHNIRSICFDSISKTEKDRIYKRIVKELENDSNGQLPAELMAYYYLRAGYKKIGMVLASRAYRELKSIHANRRALDIATEALSYCFGTHSRFRRTCLRRVAEMEEVVGETLKALRHYKNANDLYRDGMPRAALTRRTASLYQKMGKFDLAEKLLRTALQKLDSKLTIERALLTQELSCVAIMRGDHDESKKLGDAALELLDQTKPSNALAKTLNTLGIASFYAGDLMQATGFFTQGAEVQGVMNDEKSLATTLNNLGAVKNEIGKKEEARQNWQASLKIRERIGDINGLAETLNNLGILFMELGQYSRANHFYNRARELQTRIGDANGLIEILCNLGELLLLREKYSRALEVLDEGIVYAQRIDANRQLAEMYFQKAKVFLALNRPKLARQNINRCLRLAEQNKKNGRLGEYYVVKSHEKYIAGSKSAKKYLAKAKQCLIKEPDMVLDLEIVLEDATQKIQEGKYGIAKSLLGKAMEKSESVGRPSLRLHSILLLAKTMFAQETELYRTFEIVREGKALAEELGLAMPNMALYKMVGDWHFTKAETFKAFQYYRKAFQNLKKVLIEIDQDQNKTSFLSLPENLDLIRRIKTFRKLVCRDLTAKTENI